MNPLMIVLCIVAYLAGAVVTAIITYGEHEIEHRGRGWQIPQTRTGIDGGAVLLWPAFAVCLVPVYALVGFFTALEWIAERVRADV